MPKDDPATEARNVVLQIVTAARGQSKSDMVLAAALTDEYNKQNGSIYPLFISAIGVIETILISVAKEMDIDPGTLLSGICLGVSIRDIGESNNQ